MVGAQWNGHRGRALDREVKKEGDKAKIEASIVKDYKSGVGPLSLGVRYNMTQPRIREILARHRCRVPTPDFYAE